MDLFKLFGTIAIDNAAANSAIDETSGRAKDLASQLDSTSSIGGGIGSAIGKGVSAAGSVITTVGGAVLRGAAAVAKAGTVAVAAGAAAYGALTVNAMKAAGSLEQNMGGSEAVFGEYAAGIQQTAKESYATMGTATSDYLATANKMGALFQGAGFGIEESANLATSTMQRAADVASIMGLDTASAMESIAGAAKGNFTMMDNLGVAINDTTLQNYALEKGIKKSTQQMTTQEKVGLAMEMFMERTAYAAGNYAKENETLAGALGTAKAAMTNFLDGSGGINDLVPALENAGEVITENLVEIMPRLSTGLSQAAQQLAPMIPQMLQAAIPGIAEGVSTLATGFADALPGIVDALVDSAPTIVEGFGKVFESVAESMPQIMSTLTPAIADGLSGALSLVGVEIDSSAIQKTMEDIFSGLGSIGGKLAESFGEIGGTIGGIIGDIAATLSENGVTIEGVFEGIGEAVGLIAEPLNAGIGAIGSIITPIVDWATTDGTLIYEAFENIKTSAEGISGALTGVFNGISELMSGDLSGAAEAFSGAFESLQSSAATGLANTINFVSGKLGELAGLFGIELSLPEIDASAITNAFSKVSEIAGKIAGVFKFEWSLPNIGTQVLETVKSAVLNVVNPLKAMFHFSWGLPTIDLSALDGVVEAVKNVVDAIKSLFNFDLSLPTIGGGGTTSGSGGAGRGSVGVEGYASGGVMMKPTAFGINPNTGNIMVGGEAGAEAIAPIDVLQGYVAAAVASQNAAQTSILERMLDGITALNANMGASMRDAMEGVSLSVGKREFGRLVKGVT